MPVRNGFPYLPAALGSLRAQTYEDLEILVIDDGSTDETASFIRGVADRRVRLLDSQGAGIVAALNLGLINATGEFVARQDADDLSHPERFGRQVALLQAHPDIDVVACRADFIDADGRPAETPWTRDVRRWHERAANPDELRRLLPLTCCIVHGSVMARRRVLIEAGGYRPEFEWAEDYELWLRLLHDHRFARVPERLYVHRIHADRVSDRRRDQQLRRTLRAKLEYLRRAHPSLPTPARAAIVGNGRGAAMYRELMPSVGIAESASGYVDVVIQTNVGGLYEAALSASAKASAGSRQSASRHDATRGGGEGCVTYDGNFLVRT